MKKSLVILSLALAFTAYESTARGGEQAEILTSQHSSSLTSLEHNTQQRFQAHLRSSSRLLGGRSNSGVSSLMLHGNSPSSRKNNHWLIDEHDEEFMPLAPDETAEIAGKISTIEKIRRIDTKKNAVIKKEVTEKKLWYNSMRESSHIEIYVSGGGFSGGIDPIIRDLVTISNSGLVKKYFESESKGVVKYKKEVDREELIELVQWIAESGFFEMERDYSCAEGDEYCWERLNRKPTPIPLKVVVALGPYRNVISVPIFSQEKTNDFINYPENLRKIVKAIYDFASL